MLTSIDEKPYTEILDGEAVRKVSPQTRHALVQLRIAALLQHRAEARGDVGVEWRFYMDPPGGLQTSLVPDIAFVSRARLDALVGQQHEKPPISPDVAFEIRSPDDRVKNVDWKMHAYLRMGGTLAFDVLPDACEVRAFSHDGMKTYALGDTFTSEALPWLTFTVDELFAGIRD